MPQNSYTILEIGSGSYKLHRNGSFSRRFESSLGKDLEGNKLSSQSIELALNNLKKQIIPFLQEHGINLKDVIVFATAAIRKSLSDPYGSGQFFINEVIKLGFKEVKVFSESEECDYAAYAVYQELQDLYNSFLMLDTGGASHQLVEFKDGHIINKRSVPLGSHSSFDQSTLPDFKESGFNTRLPLVVIGTSGIILTHINNLSINNLEEIINALEKQSLEERRKFLKMMVADEEIHELFIDFRLAILPKAFKLIHNCANNLQVERFIFCSNQAMNYISENGLILE